MLEVRAVFCNVNKAFARVWPRILLLLGILLKLRSVGITGKLLDWFSNYLSDRKLRVVLPKDKSEWISIRARVNFGTSIILSIH